MSLLLDRGEREPMWRQVADIVESYIADVPGLPVTPELAPEKIRALLTECDFERPMTAEDAVAFAADALRRYQTHTPHPRYFGLFNPAPAAASVAADTLVAAFNPQMAAWSHSPFAVEAERHLIRAFGAKFGYAECDGTFCTAGAEANHTALLAALTNAFPEYGTDGVRALAAQPVFYVSSETHHSFLKAARISGIGTAAVRTVEVDDKLRMRADELARAIERDRQAGFAPFLVVGTAGTTNAGVIDSLRELAAVARAEGLWFHADAAWGGAAALVPEMRSLLDGIEQADSITVDAHKWMSVPMGAGVFLTRHRDILDRTFRTETAYMPREAAGLDVADPHLRTIQWSRRFTGLKVLLPLLVAGWDGYAATLRHQTEMGKMLRELLERSGWTIENDTPLPVVCFSDPAGASAHEIAMHVVASGAAWISTTLVRNRRVLRACVTNYRTDDTDVRALCEALESARDVHRHAAGEAACR